VRDLLPDSGHLQGKDAEYANRHGFSKHKPAQPLYTEQDCARTGGIERWACRAISCLHASRSTVFKLGEAVTSRQVAGLLSGALDWMITVDPHLHRYGSLGEIYTIPTRVVHAAPLLSDWIRTNVANPLIIGPDSESEQWVAAVAGDAGAPYSVLQKVRHGDRNVEIALGDLGAWKGKTPVLVDDIISTGRTMMEAARLLKSEDWPRRFALRCMDCSPTTRTCSLIRQAHAW
jgi:ribose-phosphate pyrophosphokinase